VRAATKRTPMRIASGELIRSGACAWDQKAYPLII